MAASIFERCGGLRTLIDPQTKFISSAMGGPASYSNDMLRQVHGGLKIDVVAFNEAISLLQQTMEEFELDP